MPAGFKCKCGRKFGTDAARKIHQGSWCSLTGKRRKKLLGPDAKAENWEHKTYTIQESSPDGCEGNAWECQAGDDLQDGGETQLQVLLRQALSLVGVKRVHAMVDDLA